MTGVRRLLLFLFVTLQALAVHAHAVAMSSSAQGGLTAALRLAVSEHPSVRAQLDELKALGYDLDSAESGRLAILSLNSQAMSNDQQQVVALLQQPLWAGGRIDGAIDQARISREIGRTALAALRMKLLEDTAAAYTVVQGARNRLKAAELNVHEHERLLALITRRQVGSIASEADVRFATSRLAQAVAQKIQLNGILVRALNDLKAFTQKTVDSSLPVDESLLALPGNELIVREIESISPVVRQRKIEVDLARTAADLNLSNMMPTLYAQLQQDVYSASSSGTAPRETRIGLVLNGSVEGLGLAGWQRVKSADSRVDEAIKNIDVAVNEVKRYAAAVLADLESQQQMLKSNELLVSSSEETLASFMRQYDAGRKTWVDVLNSQRELSDARLSLEQTRASLQESSLRLAAQLGRLNTNAGVEP